MTQTVLIFAHECAPFHRPQSMVGAQRPAQFAKYLGEFGWRAVVLCCDNGRRGLVGREQTLQTARDDARRALAEAAPDAPVIIPTPSLAWDGPLDRLWRKTFTPEGAPRRHKLAVTARKLLTATKLRAGDWSQAWQPAARAAAEVVAATTKVDACLGEHGPDAGLFLARWFADKYGAPWLADFRDPLPQGYRGTARRWYAAVGKRLTATAAGTINVTPYWTELDRELFGRPAHFIPNGFDPKEFAADREHGEFFEIIYAGNIIPSQRLDIFLDGLRQARETLGAETGGKLRFVYRGGAWAQVAEMAARVGVSEVCDISAAIPRAESLAHLARAQVLLLLSIAYPEREDAYFARGFYPAKTFEYFGARRPILCVPGDNAMLDKLLKATQTGVTAGDATSVAAYLTKAAELHNSGGEIAYAPNAELVAQYSRRNLTGSLAAILDNVIQTR